MKGGCKAKQSRAASDDAMPCKRTTTDLNIMYYCEKPEDKRMLIISVGGTRSLSNISFE